MNLLKFSTSRFGEIELKEEEAINMPKGLIGFPELKRFVLLDHDKDSPFKWLQSLDDGAIAFVLINPLLFKADYTVEVTESEVEELSLENEDDAVISVIITIPTDPKKMTANLKAPVVFNLQNRKGKQIILNNPQYTTRHNIVDEMQKNPSSEQSGLQETVEQAKSAGAAKRRASNKKKAATGTN